MSEKPSDRVIQVAVGLLLILLSAAFLWTDTIKPILRSKFDLDHFSDALKAGVRYWSWKDRAEDARRRAIEADLERMRSEQEKASREEQREESK
jgi:hypothetical protein